MNKINGNLLDLEAFRLRKQEEKEALLERYTSFSREKSKTPSIRPELSLKIENIRKSIKRINAIMTELRHTSNKPY